MSFKATVYAVPAIALLMAGCASKPPEPTMLDLMRAQKAELQTQVDLKAELVREWEQGTQQLAEATRRQQEAERRASQAERRLRDAERDLRRAQQDAERARAEGEAARARIAGSESRFRDAFPEVAATAPAR